MTLDSGPKNQGSPDATGSANVVCARLGSQRIAFTTGPTFTAVLDDPITLSLDPSTILLFHTVTENRLAS